MTNKTMSTTTQITQKHLSSACKNAHHESSFKDHSTQVKTSIYNISGHVDNNARKKPQYNNADTRVCLVPILIYLHVL